MSAYSSFFLFCLFPGFSGEDGRWLRSRNHWAGQTVKNMRGIGGNVSPAYLFIILLRDLPQGRHRLHRSDTVTAITNQIGFIRLNCITPSIKISSTRDGNTCTQVYSKHHDTKEMR